MDARRAGLAIAVLLLFATAAVAWFDYAALSAVLHPVRDAAGNTEFAVPGYSNEVYPFTYAGVALSLVGVSLSVFARERREMRPIYAAGLAILIANLASVGMIDWYEQVWLGIGYFTSSTHADAVYWLPRYFGTAGGLAGTVSGLLLVFVVLPWSRRTNWPGVLTLLALAGFGFLLWFANGYGGPMSGDALDYAMNALTRCASQAALVAAVAPRDFVREAVRWVRSLRAGNRSGSTERSAPIAPPGDPSTRLAPRA